MTVPPPSLHFLCVLAMPRTGSSHLNKLLKSIPQINAKSELFHKQRKIVFAPREVEELERRSGVPVADLEASADWRRAHPALTLEALREAKRKPVVAFKVFPDHLSRDLIENKLFSRSDIGFVVLSRRPIECFISNRKAKEAGKFSKVDTTALKVVLSVEEFGHWVRRMRQWYRWTRRMLEARGPYVELSYERHLDVPPAQSLAEIIALLEPLGFHLTMPKEIIEGERQDREKRYQDRVANWDEFEAAVRADAELAPLLDWAQQAG